MCVTRARRVPDEPPCLRPDANVIIENRSLEEKFDPEMRFRPLLPRGRMARRPACFWCCRCFHYYTAGFGLLPETTHRGIHMAFVLGLIFLVFSGRQARPGAAVAPSTCWRPLGISLVDWALADRRRRAGPATCPGSSTISRSGSAIPIAIDVVMGTILIVVLLEATRRSVGWPLPIIAIVLMVYAYLGPSHAGHPRASRRHLVEHRQPPLPDEPGHLRHRARRRRHLRLPLRAVRRARDPRRPRPACSSISPPAWPGAIAGGPAKVSIFGSALFGMISGSSIANTVTVGSLTIPAMIRLGYHAPFRGGGGIGGLDRRADHAADHGRGGLPDDRVPRRCPTRPSSWRRSCRPSCISSACSCRSISRPSAPGCAACRRTRCPTLREVVRARLADGHAARRAADRAVLRLHALSRGVLGHHGLHRRRPHACRHHARVPGAIVAAIATGMLTRLVFTGRSGIGRSHSDLHVPQDEAGKARCSTSSTPSWSAPNTRSRRRRCRDRRHHRRRRHADRRRLQAVLHRHRRRPRRSGAGVRRTSLPAWPVRH